MCFNTDSFFFITFLQKLCNIWEVTYPRDQAKHPQLLALISGLFETIGKRADINTNPNKVVIRGLVSTRATSPITVDIGLVASMDTRLSETSDVVFLLNIPLTI